MAAGFGFAAATGSRLCPCGSGLAFVACCRPLHRGEQQAQTAEQLMRSRYAAYACGVFDYLIQTHPIPGEPLAKRRKDLRESCRQTRWLGLEIIAVERGGSADLEGTVQFKASFQVGGHRGVLEETSLFQRRDRRLGGEWLYIKPLALDSGGTLA